MLRFLISGLAILVFVPFGNGIPYVEIVITLLTAALVVALIEQWMEATVLSNPDLWAIRMTPFTRVTLIIFFPILIIPRFIGRRFFRMSEKPFAVTEDELNQILDASQEEGVLEDDEREMIGSIIELRDTPVREIMIPRTDMIALNADAPVTEAIDRMLASGYSRVPVYSESIDTIVGILYIKDLLRLMHEGREQEHFTSELRDPVFVPETKKVDELFTEMQSERVHIVIAVDEYGGVAGLLTLEDIIEELFGEIQDEYDFAEEQEYENLGEGKYLFDGRIDIDDFNELMEMDLPRDDADTLGGYLFSQFGHVPENGESIEVDDILLTVTQVNGQRIQKINAQRNHPAETH
jgi:CBS domain containing-hemolysin-like protein